MIKKVMASAQGSYLAASGKGSTSQDIAWFLVLMIEDKSNLAVL